MWAFGKWVPQQEKKPEPVEAPVAVEAAPVPQEVVEEPVVETVEPAPEPVSPKLTPRSRRVLMLAEDEAKRLGHDYIGTEHLMIGILREGEGVAAGVLESCGVSLEKARKAVLFIVGAPPRPEEVNDADRHGIILSKDEVVRWRHAMTLLEKWEKERT